MSSSLASRKCAPCEGKASKLEPVQIGPLLLRVRGWEAKDGKLQKSLGFKDFVTAMEFLNRVAEIAEQEGHHPDFCVHYNRVEFSIFTHTIDGLSDNDFILAAKIDAIT